MGKWFLTLVLIAGAIILIAILSRSSNGHKNLGSTVSADLPLVFNPEVGFTSQAPFGQWDVLHNESCEEASVLMAYAWVHHLGLSPDYVDRELHRLADWENTNFGSFEKNLSAKETAQLAKEFYGLSLEVKKNPTAEEIKQEVASGHLVIMGMAGRWLGNPYFKSPGPVYHMLVIKGYDQNGFFTNDPGTIYGANFYYRTQTIMKAAHDWTGTDESIYTSPAVALIVSK